MASRLKFLRWQRVGVLFVLVLGLSISLAACGGGRQAEPKAAPPQPTAQVEEHDEAAGHQDEPVGHQEELEGHTGEQHVAGEHSVPEEALALENPIPATEESIEKGRQLYLQNCAVCHGEQGYGDGPSAAALDPKPANLHEDHVQGVPDGMLFWVISHGVPETAMPPWDKALSEEERWHIVNFLRTFK